MSHADEVLRAVHRKISVKGTGGVAATVVVIAQRGQVWMSIQPPFTWEAVMQPGKVDELIHALGLAREDAKQMVGGKRASHGDKQQQVDTAQCHPETKP